MPTSARGEGGLEPSHEEQHQEDDEDQAHSATDVHVSFLRLAPNVARGSYGTSAEQAQTDNARITFSNLRASVGAGFWETNSPLVAPEVVIDDPS